MAGLIWSGAIVTLVGVIVLFYCIVAAIRARRADDGDEVLRARLKRVVTINLAALFISAFGLIMVITGIVLG